MTVKKKISIVIAASTSRLDGASKTAATVNYASAMITSSPWCLRSHVRSRIYIAGVTGVTVTSYFAGRQQQQPSANIISTALHQKFEDQGSNAKGKDVASSSDDDVKDSSLNTSDYLTEDCSICKEYSAGPCGKQFLSWQNCTTRFGSDYVIQCKQNFDDWRSCMAEHDENDDGDNDYSI